MGRGGRGMGGMRGGGGRMGGGFGRAGSGRIGGSIGSGGAGRAGRGLGGVGRAPVAPRASAPRVAPPRRGPGFGTGLGLGMGLGMGMGRRRGFGWGWGGGWGWRRRPVVIAPGGGPAGGGCGCGTLLTMLLVLAVVLVLISMIGNFSMPFGGGGFRTLTVTPSTQRREALPRTAANDSIPMLTDNLGWIGNTTRLNVGLDNFQSQTGVRPHLYITGDIDGSTALPSLDTLSAFVGRRYDEIMGGNEAHVLFVFFENVAQEYAMYVTAGNQARLVMDEEGRNILMDFVQRYYYSDLDEETMFSRAFDGAGRHLMRVTRSQWIPVLVVAGILLAIFLLFSWWKRKQAQKNLEAEQTERILSQSLDTFGSESDDEASKLAKQYEDEN